MVRLDGVHTFGYNSAEGEPIWMKFGALLEHCLPLALADFGRDTLRSESDRRNNCQVNNERLYRFPVGQISRNLHTRRGSVRWSILSEQNFENFPVRGRFLKKAFFSPKSLTTCDFRPPLLRNITDRRKLTTKWSLYIDFPFLALESTQSHSHGQQITYRERSRPSKPLTKPV